VNGLRTRAEVRLEIPDIQPPSLVRAQDALNDLQERSGAMAGAFVMLLLLVAGVTEVVQRNPSLISLRAAIELLGVMALAFGLGFVARLGQCVYRRWRFARLCREQHRLLAVEIMQPAMQPVML